MIEEESRLFFENNAGVMWFEDGIIYGYHKYEYITTVEQTKEFVEARLEVQKDLGSLPAIVDGSNVKKISKAARDYYANEGAEGISCCAIIVRGKLNSIIVNALLAIVDRNTVLTRTFTSKVEAKRWITKRMIK